VLPFATGDNVELFPVGTFQAQDVITREYHSICNGVVQDRMIYSAIGIIYLQLTVDVTSIFKLFHPSTALLQSTGGLPS
jgi:hypothetical protein